MSKQYDFGEKKEEVIKGKKLPVEFLTPKYKEAKKKAIELIESEEYKNVLLPSDFWILYNTYAEKTKVMYSGLIISHDGCLKINDALDSKLRFKPECLKIDKDGYKNSLVFTYICPEQGIYEVGEVSGANCQNDYPYAMALKRCMDRVILKNSKIAYSGIYSDSEADEFAKRNNDVDFENKSNENQMTIEQTIVIAELEPSLKEHLRKHYQKDPLKLTYAEAEEAIASLKKNGLLKDKLEKKEEEIF